MFMTIWFYTGCVVLSITGLAAVAGMIYLFWPRQHEEYHGSEE